MTGYTAASAVTDEAAAGGRRRDGSRSGKRAMKIYFCDKCNCSIPIKDIEANKISIDAGKIYCHNCAPKPNRPTKSFNYPTLAIAVMLGVGVGMVCMALWGDRLLGRTGGPTVESRLANLEKSVNGLRDDTAGQLGAIAKDLEEAPGVDGTSGKLASALQGIRDNGDAIQSVRHRFNGLADELRSDIDRRINDLGNQFRDATETVDELNELVKDRVSTDIDSVREQLALLSEEIAAMDARLAGVEAAPRAGGGSTVVPVVSKEPTLSPDQEVELDNLLKGTKSATPGERFAAVVGLIDFRVRRAEEALVGVLEDKLDYIKTAALNNLAEMEAKWTIPHVIERLKDAEPYVRETAIEALEKLMGRSVGISPDAPMSKLLAKSRELTTWWEENKARILLDS